MNLAIFKQELDPPTGFVASLPIRLRAAFGWDFEGRVVLTASASLADIIQLRAVAAHALGRYAVHGCDPDPATAAMLDELIVACDRTIAKESPVTPAAPPPRPALAPSPSAMLH